MVEYFARSDAKIIWQKYLHHRAREVEFSKGEAGNRLWLPKLSGPQPTTCISHHNMNRRIVIRNRWNILSDRMRKLYDSNIYIIGCVRLSFRSQIMPWLGISPSLGEMAPPLQEQTSFRNPSICLLPNTVSLPLCWREKSFGASCCWCWTKMVYFGDGNHLTWKEWLAIFSGLIASLKFSAGLGWVVVVRGTRESPRNSDVVLKYSGDRFIHCLGTTWGEAQII